VRHVRDACLFDHSPSPQRCARAGGVWDDTWAATAERGGACVSAQEAARRLAAGGAELEAVDVALSSDGNLSAFLPAGGGAVPASIRRALRPPACRARNERPQRADRLTLACAACITMPLTHYHALHASMPFMHHLRRRLLCCLHRPRKVRCLPAEARARRCIRHANVASGHRQMMAYFGAGCAAELDAPALAAFEESDEYEPAQEALERAQAHAAAGLGARRRQRVAYELRPPPAPPRRARCGRAALCKPLHHSPPCR